MTEEIQIPEPSKNPDPVLVDAQYRESTPTTVVFAAAAVFGSAFEFIVPGYIEEYTRGLVMAAYPLFMTTGPFSSFYRELYAQNGLPFICLFAVISAVPQYYLGKLHVSGLSLLTTKGRRGQFARILWLSALALWSVFLAVLIASSKPIFIAPILCYLLGCYCGLFDVQALTPQTGESASLTSQKHALEA